MNFPAEFFVNNRKRLAAMLPNSLIVISANMPMLRAGDSPYPFKQDSNFWYFTGISEPNIVLVIDTKNNTELISLPNLSTTQELFNGQIDTQQLEHISGIKTYTSHLEALQMHNKLSIYNEFYANLPEKIKDAAVNPLHNELYLGLKKKVKKFKSLIPMASSLRMIKQPAELAALTEAVAITKQAFGLIKNALASGVQNEKELLSIANQYFALKCVEHGYEPIVASGGNGLVLHYTQNNQMFSSSSQVVLVDIGAEYNNYSADISRTFSLCEGPNTKIITAVSLAQQEIISFVKPGVSWRALHEYSEQALVKHLCLAGEDVSMGNIKDFYPHAVGHFLGLNVQDVGDYKQPLAENMVITIEPGYYNIKNGFGVRIEDDVLVTASGAKVL